ncbi:hypothetical protein BS50DRAFT_270160 [Corynespora cassiicola Philippines]|uniref:SAC3/GANP/THP3 conserved domain-containing protein n=1 Tax=Corynespora cassiicola Philippines TaxID=1448308 RepID=A0A2T2P0A5_CORCC|nr:hypothetical protein BS50DRAFT_270160 [Corynespora cassiicola Philippines]
MLRDRYVQEGLMNPEGQIQLDNAVQIKGICEDMCPEYERVSRIAENHLRASEYTPETAHGERGTRIADESRMVKRFKRSAAGDETELISDIRTPSACKKSMEYLARLLDAPDGLRFHQPMVWDSTRAVRRDLTTQNIDGPRETSLFLECFEMCVRIHLVCHHALANNFLAQKEAGTRYESHMEKEQMLNALTSLKQRYSDIRGTNLAHCATYEPEILAYRIILAVYLQETSIESEIAFLGNLMNNQRVQTALSIYRTGKTFFNRQDRPASFPAAQQNWESWWSQIKSFKVSYLMACAAELAFDVIRENVLKTIARSFRQGSKTMVDAWTLPKLAQALGTDNEQQTRACCEHFQYTIRNNDEGVPFLDLSEPVPKEAVPYSMDVDMTSGIVEAKRGDRQYFAIAQGITIGDARRRNMIVQSLLMNKPVGLGESADDSLFIPEVPFQAADVNQPTLGANMAKPFASSSPFQAKPSPAQDSLTPFQAPASQGNNPFMQGASPKTVQPGLFDPSRNAISFAPPAANTAISNPFAKFTANAASPSTAASPTPSNNIFAPSAPLTNGGTSAATNVFSPKPEVQPPAPSTAQDEEKRKLEEQQKALEEQKRLEEERQRLQQEQERQAQEAARAEQERRAREAEEQRRQQLEEVRRKQEERKRQEIEAQQQILRQQYLLEEQQRQRQRQQANLVAMQREQDQATDTLVRNALDDDDEPGLGTIILNRELQLNLRQAFKDVCRQLEAEDNEQRVQYMLKKVEISKARRALYWFVHQVRRKQKVRQTRNRRQRIRAIREQEAERKKMAELNPEQAEATAIQAPNGSATAVVPDKPNEPVRKPEEFKKPELPASSRRARKNITAQVRDTVEVPVSLPQTNNTLRNDYQMPFKDPKAPIDRTQTDYFQLKLKGIDPFKQRKRSFGSSTGSESDEKVKRLRTSATSTPRNSLPPTTQSEESISRWRSLIEEFDKPILGSAISNGSSSFSPKNSFGPVQHDFSRSVPNLGLSRSILGRSSFGVSVSSAGSNDGPAYRNRKSRFVPAHLYGKGADAVAEYRRSLVGSSGANSPVINEPLQLSSPIPTQQSYTPPSMAQHEAQASNDLYFGQPAVDVDADDEGHYSDDEVMTEEEEESDEMEEQYGQFEEEEDYEEEEDESDSQQDAQLRPGATQDDAIELSD